MNAQFLTITRRNRDHDSGAYAAPSDFEWMAAGEARFEDVVPNPRVTLYCIDSVRELALFVETPPDVDLAAQPFFYLAQARSAIRLVGVPWGLFVDWGDRCPTPNRIVLFYSVGRCGSTLLSKLIESVPEILAINEPDALMNLERLLLEGMTVAQARPLLRAIVRHLWKPGLKGGVTWEMIKFRQEHPAIEGMLAEEFPAAKMLFMYRSAEEVVPSFIKMRGHYADAVERLKVRLDQIRKLQRVSSQIDQLWAEHGHFGLEVAQWAWSIEQYLAIRARGGDIPAIRYEDLVAAPDRIMEKLLSHWGLHWDPSVTPGIMAEDSQKATPVARRGEKAPLSREQRDVLHRLLPTLSSISSADVILPGTLA